MTTPTRDDHQFELPAVPRRVVIGQDAHAVMKDALLRARDDLEVRGAPFRDITAADVEWGEVYVGFRAPPLPDMGNIRWVHSTGAGVDPWFYPNELPRSILLTRSPESFGPMIAEWALARALAFTQQIVPLSEAQSEQRWEKRDIPRLGGSKVVVVGTGDVGAHVAALFKALGCRVHGVSRSGARNSEVFESVVTIAGSASVLRDAGWVIVTLPLTNATRGVIGREFLSHCTNAVFMNAGRGLVVDEAVLPEALEKGWIRGAALDVFQEEPLPPASPLWKDKRIMISPHIAGLTTVDGAISGFLECLQDLEAGRAPKWRVDRERQY